MLNWSALALAEAAAEDGVPAQAAPASSADLQDGDMLMNSAGVRLFFLLAYVLVFVFCVLGNLAVLLVIATNRSMCTATNFFLANLAVADLLVGVFCVFQNAVHFVLFQHGAWPFGKALCHSYIYILHMIPNASAGILVGVGESCAGQKFCPEVLKVC